MDYQSGQATSDKIKELEERAAVEGRLGIVNLPSQAEMDIANQELQADSTWTQQQQDHLLRVSDDGGSRDFADAGSSLEALPPAYEEDRPGYPGREATTPRILMMGTLTLSWDFFPTKAK